MAKSTARAEMSNAAWEGTIDRMNFPTGSELHLPADVSYDIGGRTIIENRTVDRLKLLPEKSQVKLLGLRQERQDVSATIYKAVEVWNEKHADKIEAELHYLQLVDRDAASRDGRGMTYGEEHPLVVEAKEKVETAKAELARFTDIKDARSFRMQQISPILQNVDKYLKDYRNVRLVEHEAVSVELKNEAVSTAVERIRKEIAKLGADRHSVNSAPYPSEYVKRRVRGAIHGFAQSGKPDLFEAIEADGPIKWPESIIRSDPILHALGPDKFMPVNGLIETTMHSARDFLCWAFEDQIIAKVQAEVDACADDANALSHIDRQTKLKSIADEILEAERIEERLVEMSVEQGQPIPRRPEADPRAVLGIDGPAPKADY